MTQRELILERFREAELAPSAIDRLLGLARGTARRTIVQWWDEQRKKKASAKGEGD